MAVGAIADVLTKFAFSGPSGPAHTISTPNQLDTYTRNPNLEKAKKVRVVTVLNEKNFDRKHSAEELSKSLARHGIDVVLDKVDAKGRPIGAVLDAYVASHEVDVLVMGAYGHSRLREFVLGGATKSLLSNPPAPILFSH